METQKELSARALQYHASAMDWASDLEFFRLEAIFLHRLLDDYFIRLSAPEYVQKLKDIEHDLLDLENNRHELDKLVTGHLNEINLTTMDVVAKRTEDLELMHIRLGYRMTELMHEFRHTKKILFAVVEEVVKDDALLRFNT